MSEDPYQGSAGIYAAIFDRVNAPLHRLVRRRHPPPDGGRILDIGCGTGAQLAGYTDEGLTLAGVDRSEAMLEKARARIGSEADLRLGSATDLPFEDDSFDQVLMSLVLHEMAPEVRLAVMREARRVLAPSGQALVVEFGVEPMDVRGRILRAISWPLERLAGAQHFRSFRRFLGDGGFPSIAARSGFTLDSVRPLLGGNTTLYVAVPSVGG